MFIKQRCTNCKKKDLIFDCKCLNKYCLNCLKSYIHKCEFDYNNTNKKYLTENNEKICPVKVEAI